MTQEQILINKWRELNEEKQQEVLDFVEFLHQKNLKSNMLKTSSEGKTLGDRLEIIRNKIIDSGIPLLDNEQVEREVKVRRGGYQEQE